MNIVFKRSTSGITNQHFFHNVDFVIFVEGGKKSFTKEEIYNGSYHSETEDIIFWKNIFDTFVNGKKLKFKSVGSKTTIKEIAIDIINNDIETVLIAIDNEFDEPFNNRIEHPNIYYTNGYSWENDLWNDDLIKDIVEELSAVKVTNSDIEQNYSKFIRDLKFAVYADAYLFKKGDSFFKRKSGHLFCIVCNPVDLPSVRKEMIDSRVTDKGIINKGTVYSFGNRYSINTAKHCFGHLLADYCCQVVIHYLKNRHGLKNLSKDLIYRIAISRFFANRFEDSNSFNYYEEQFERNVA
jgi:hypothetical protein